MRREPLKLTLRRTLSRGLSGLTTIKKYISLPQELTSLDPPNEFKPYIDPLERFSGGRLKSFLNKYQR